MQASSKTLIRQPSGDFICPKCYNVVIWSCSLGDSGYAYCSKSLCATQTMPMKKSSIGSKIKSYCTWTGKVKRKNKKIIIIYNSQNK